MGATPYKPVSWNGEPITDAKLNTMTNNDQWLFENAARLRYTSNELVRDAGLKVLAGRTPHPKNVNNFVYVDIDFANYFTEGCNPVVTATVESNGGFMHRSHCVVQGRQGPGNSIGTNGFTVIITNEAQTTIAEAGWINWIAVGY